MLANVQTFSCTLYIIYLSRYKFSIEGDYGMKCPRCTHRMQRQVIEYNIPVYTCWFCGEDYYPEEEEAESKKNLSLIELALRS